ncbi:DUF547 domain-containing protein [Henriciella sp.]|uniref:DUF547 domain-containing protein n=1 Tax=Henriciella sp. TaxID=1968823 RepID=UPI002637B99E|nr:DUF547 domain-containing protein [Henriciella sp.]
MMTPSLASFSPLRIALVLLAFALSGAAAHAKAGEVSHDGWGALLERYVVASEDGVNRVDYAALKDSRADRDQLNRYIAQFAGLDFSTLSRDEQFAAWANLYNAVTVRYIVNTYPRSTIKPWYSTGPWKKITVTANGGEISLDGIEHDVLRVEWSDDPRLHYAINCASYGCPNLRRDPWRAATLDEDLDAAARAYINHPRGVTVLRRGLRVSSIYDWFREDFGGSEAGVIAHLLDYADPALADEIRANPDIRDHEYDWSLNDTDQ